MNVNRAAFLALTASIAAASAACSASGPGTGSASDDIVQEGGGPIDEGGPATEGSVCLANNDDTPMPYAEGWCADFANRMEELEYIDWLTPSAEGTTSAEAFGCTPYSASHPASEGVKLCPMWSWHFSYDRCQVYASQFKKESAYEAFSCLEGITKLPDSTQIYDCGYEALDRSCGYHPTAESTCALIESSVVEGGGSWTNEKAKECYVEVSGLRADARAQIEAAAKAQGAGFMLHSAIEGLKPQ